ncbi:MAG: hypothetical protein IT381_01065 [Deltaproteobacteria bacterium]|nr:hypothetical protein [Deltaproteobacteria bacterium]
MAETAKPEPAATPATDKPQTKKVFCFVSKRDIEESEAVEMPYSGGQKMWVGKQYVKFKQ